MFKVIPTCWFYHTALLCLVHPVSCQTVLLMNSLNGRSVAYPDQLITFTYVIKGSPIIAWSSTDYIGQDVQLEFTTTDQLQSIQNSTINTNTFAVLVSITDLRDGGIGTITSQLHIQVSPLFQTSSVSCHNVGLNTVNTSTFQCLSELQN